LDSLPKQPSHSPLTVTCFTDTDLVHTSFITTGLIELAAAGLVDLTFKLDKHFPNIFHARRGIFTTVLEVESWSKKKSICIDLHDSKDYFAVSTLEGSDAYYKANFNQDAISTLPKEHQAKIKPFGPYFACRPNREKSLLLRYCGYVFERVRKDGYKKYVPLNRSSAGNLYRLFTARYKRYTSRLRIGDYEMSAKNPSPKESTIFFNPGFWAETTEDIKRTNALRAEIIQRLKEKYKEKFIGGFVDSPAARKKYPDCIMDKKLDHAAYIEQCKRSSICIYTNGVNGCISWKLGEYLAAGACIVGEKLNRQLAIPLVQQNTHMEFETPDSCLQHIGTLMKSPELMLAIQDNVRIYYQQYASPSSSIWRILMESVGR
jgi:hypothetical protein